MIRLLLWLVVLEVVGNVSEILYPISDFVDWLGVQSAFAYLYNKGESLGNSQCLYEILSLVAYLWRHGKGDNTKWTSNLVEKTKTTWKLTMEVVYIVYRYDMHCFLKSYIGHNIRVLHRLHYSMYSLHSLTCILCLSFSYSCIHEFTSSANISTCSQYG